MTTIIGTPAANPVASSVDSSVEDIYTFDDAVARLDIATQARCAVRDRNILRLAVSNAYREMPHKHDWKYYKRTFQFTTAPKTEYSSLTYNAAERTATLSGQSVWPAGAEFGKLFMDGNLYTIEAKLGNQQVRLQATNAPTTYSGGAVTWARNSYPIPGVRRVASLVEVPTDYPLIQLSQEHLAEFLRISNVASEPTHYTIQGLGIDIGKMTLELAPPPELARTYILSGDMRPRPIRIYRDVVPVTVVGATATPTTAVLYQQKHVGAIVRFSSTSTEPTGTYGEGGEYNPYVFQRKIVSVNGSGVATLSSAGDVNLTAVSSVVSDPLDIHPEMMLNYFDALATTKLMAMAVGVKDEAAFALEARALREAIGADNMMKQRSHAWYEPYDFSLVARFPSFAGE